MLRTVVAMLACSLPVALHAGEFNPKLNIGDAAPAWKDLPGTDGKKHSLADLDSKKLVVVVFTCNSCPAAKDYEDRTIEFAKRHAEHLAVVAINVNRIPEDSLPNMQERAKQKGFQHAYLFDESQQIARDYGAGGTPEFFLLSSDRKIVYMGAMDDHHEPAKVQHRYLEDAVQAVLKGAKLVKAETYAPGCRIRYVKTREK